MKNLLLLGILLSCFGCSTEDNLTNSDDLQNSQTARVGFNNPKNNAPVSGKVILLQVDFVTHTFEGAKEMTFTPNPNFTISCEYVSPIDFGNVTLKYSELNQDLFRGSIIWMGLGAMQYPANMESATAFPTIPNALPLPNYSQFSAVMYNQYAYYPDPIPYSQIWNAISNLQVVAQYRASNPSSSINVFLYTPSVGVGNPADWDYYVILKN